MCHILPHDIAKFGWFWPNKMAVSRGEPQTVVFIHSVRGLRGKILGTQKGEAWEGFTAEVIWEPSVKDYMEGFC